MKILVSILLTFFYYVSYSQNQIIEKCDNYRKNYTYFAQSIGTNAQDYNWKVNYNGVVQYYNTPSINITFEDSGYCLLELFIEDEINCESLIQKYEISIIPCQETTFYIPNSFTPNGDGLNDIFKPKGENFSEFEMFIYNRWGEMIYYSNNTSGWDGGVAGYYVPEGVYCYIITYRDIKKRPIIKIGSLTLIR
jgi:gliding motility-associated-like protein